MQIKRWQHLGVLASVLWVIASSLLASWNETWLLAWRLYCSFTADPTCAGASVFLVVHWGAIAVVVILPLVLAWLMAWGVSRLTRGFRRVA